jgi:hypothetical protein
VPRCAQLIQTLCFASASKLRRDSALRPHFERQGKALINFKTSKPDNVHYSLDCTNGHFSGVAQTALYGKYNILHVGATSNYDHR